MTIQLLPGQTREYAHMTICANRNSLIRCLLDEADAHNHEWLKPYLVKNFAEIVSDVLDNQPLKHGFRGLEMRDMLLRWEFVQGRRY